MVAVRAVSADTVPVSVTADSDVTGSAVTAGVPVCVTCDVSETVVSAEDCKAVVSEVTAVVSMRPGTCTRSFG